MGPGIDLDGRPSGVLLPRFSGRAVCGWVWMRDDDREWDDPIIDALGQPAEDVNAFLEVIRRLLGRTLLYMSLDAVQLADVAPHSEF